MARFGWRNAVLTLAGLLAALTIAPLWLVLRRRPRLAEHAGSNTSRPLLYDVGRTSPNRSLTISFALATAVNMAFLVHLIPLLLVRGFPLATASIALGSIGVMKLVGRLFITPLALRITTARATVLVFVLQAIGLVALAASSSAAALWLCVALVGIGDGASTPARAELVAEVHGPARYGTVSGVLALFLAVARAAGPVGVSFVYAATGSYSAALALMTVSLLAAGWLLAPPGRVGPRRDRADVRPASFSEPVRLPGRTVKRTATGRVT